MAEALSTKLLIVLEDGQPLWLTDDGFDDEQMGRTVRPAGLADMTAALVGEYLDDDCENENHHSLVGAHAALSRLLVEKCGHVHAAEIMVAVLDCGGLRQMAKTGGK